MRYQLHGLSFIVIAVSFKAQMKKADASDAKIALIIGEEEVAAQSVNVKMLRDEGQSQNLVGS